MDGVSEAPQKRSCYITSCNSPLLVSGLLGAAAEPQWPCLQPGAWPSSPGPGQEKALWQESEGTHGGMIPSYESPNDPDP